MINRQGQQYGPYTVDQLNLYLQEVDPLLPSDYAWHDGLKEWSNILAIEGVTYNNRPAPTDADLLTCIDQKVIKNSTSELREFLKLSCLYLAASDQQFTSDEQEWIDKFSGPEHPNILLAVLVILDGIKFSIGCTSLFKQSLSMKKRSLLYM